MNNKFMQLAQQTFLIEPPKTYMLVMVRCTALNSYGNYQHIHIPEHFERETMIKENAEVERGEIARQGEIVLLPVHSLHVF